jgi:trans-2,3-dihydro-3-hydroxyanthranilate isomerase
MKLDFALIDAFADRPFTGNPCTVVFGADALSDEQMLAIAKEMNQSETAFILRTSTSDLKARYFTPEREIPLAGHPTIATVHAALERGLLRTPSVQTSLSLELHEGPIRVEVEVREKSDRLIRMFQRKPVFGETHDPDEVLPLFGLSAEDLLGGNCKIQTVSTGTRQLMVPLKSHESLKKLNMNAPAYKKYRESKTFFSPHFFTLQGVSKDAQTFARHLGTPPDTLEDAFTGSATGAMAAYLWKYGLIQQPRFIAEQGHWMSRPGRAWVEVLGPPQDIDSISVAGTAVTVASGTLSL